MPDPEGTMEVAEKSVSGSSDPHRTMPPGVCYGLRAPFPPLALRFCSPLRTGHLNPALVVRYNQTVLYLDLVAICMQNMNSDFLSATSRKI